MARAKKRDMAVIKRVFWIGFFFLIAALVISMVQKKKETKVRDVLIDIEQLNIGYSLINTEDVLMILENSFGYTLTGLPVGGIDVERVERVLKADHFVKEAKVYIDAQNIVHIELTQRQPILRIIDKNGFTYYLDEEGGQVPWSKHYTPKVLIATGNIKPYDSDYKTKKRHVLKDLHRLTKRIEIDPFLKPMIEQVYVTKTGDYQLIPKVGDQKIILGNLDRLEQKILYLKNFYKKGFPYKGWQKYKTINLTFKGQVVAEKR